MRILPNLFDLSLRKFKGKLTIYPEQENTENYAEKESSWSTNRSRTKLYQKTTASLRQTP